MESDHKYVLVFGLLTGVTGFVLHLVKNHYEEIKKKHNTIKQMDAVHTPKSLSKLGSIEGEQFTMVSGVCVGDLLKA